MDQSKILFLLIIGLFLVSFTIAEVEVTDLNVDEDILNPGEEYQLHIETEESLETGEEIEVEERKLVDGEEIYEDTKVFTIGEENRNVTHIFDLGLDSNKPYFSQREIAIQNNFARFNVEPTQYLNDVDFGEETQIVTDTNDADYEEIAESLNEVVDGDIVDADRFDEDFREEHSNMVLLGESSTISYTGELADNAEEIKDSGNLQSSELNLATIELEDLTATVVNGGDSEGVSNSNNLLKHLLEDELEDFEEDAAVTLTEEEYRETVSHLADLDLTITPPADRDSGDEIVFSVELENNENYEFAGEVFIQNTVFDNVVNRSEEFALGSGEITEGSLSTETGFEPGTNEVLIEIKDENENIIESFSESYDVLAEFVENALNVEAEITGADFESEIEIETTVDNLMDETVEVERNVNHTSDGETINEENSSVSFSPETSTSNSFTLENNTVEGNNTVEISYLHEDHGEIAFAKDNVTVESPDGPEVNLFIHNFENALEVETVLGHSEAFEDHSIELEYLKDDVLIMRDSMLIEDHGSTQIWTYTHDELESEIHSVTGDSSIFGEHTFSADIVGASGSSEDTVEITPDQVQETFDAGWNMISGEVSADELRASCDVVNFNGEPFWSYRNGDWQNPQSMESMHGYYVYFETGCSAPLEESAENPSFVSDVTLNEGWNMFSTLETISFDNLETTCEPVENSDEDIIWQYQPGENEWETFDGSYSLEPHEGYFLKTEEACQIEHSEHN